MFGLKFLIWKTIFFSRYLNHLVKLIDGIHILCDTKISFEKIEEAKRLLTSFSDDFEVLYGEKNSVSNVHLVRHLADCVKWNGPLFAYSNYHFEDNIGHLVSLHKGTTDVTSQIAEKYLLEKNLFRHIAASPIAEEFQRNIDSKHKYSFCRKVEDSIVIGKPRLTTSLSVQEQDLILIFTDGLLDAQIEVYDSILLNRYVFYESINKSNKRTDDSFIFNHDNEKFARIRAICVINEKIYILADEKYEVDIDLANKCKSVTYLKESNDSFLRVITPNSIGSKFAIIHFENIITCSRFPNMYERD